jgi:hypothetical protein
LSEGQDYSFDLESIFLLKTNDFINKYFRCINGFIGHDYLLLQSIVFDVLYYHFINQEELEPSINETRKVELGISFSLFISIIYSIKEKYLYFIGSEIDNGKIKFDKSILSEDGKQAIINVFNKSYKTIGKYCDARNHFIHSTYDIDINDKDEICFSLSPFNFRVNQEIDSEVKFVFSINEEEIRKVLNAIYLLRVEYVDIISRKENIDIYKMEQKYLNGNVFRLGM